MSYRKLLAREPKTNEEVDELIKVIQDNPPCEKQECYCVSCAAREEIILSQLRKLWWICKRNQTPNANTEELMADGIIATHKLLDEFVAGTKSGCFSDYLWTSARNSIRTSDLRNGPIKLTQRTKVLSWAVFKFKSDYQKKYAHNPTPRQIALEMMMNRMKDHDKYTNIDLIKKHIDTLEKNINLIFDLNRWSVRLDDPIYRGEDMTIAETIGEEDSLPMHLDLKDQIESIFKILNSEEKLVLGHYYGIHIGDIKYEKLNPQEIADILGKDIGHSAVQERRKKIIRKIRDEESLWTEAQIQKIKSIKPKTKTAPNRTKSAIWDKKEQIKQDYDKGLSIDELAEIYSSSNGTIRSILKDQGYKPKKRGVQPMSSKAWKEADIIKQYYLDGNTSEQISKEYDCSAETIRTILKSKGVTLTRGRMSKGIVWKSAEIIKEKYLSGATMDQLAKEYNSNHTTIRQILRDQGVQSRKRGRKK